MAANVIQMSRSRRSLNPANTEGSDMDNDDSRPTSPTNGAGPSSKRVKRTHDVQDEVNNQLAKEMS